MYLCFVFVFQLLNNQMHFLLLCRMVDERISKPLFVLLKHLYQLCQKDDKRRHRLFSLLLEMYHKYPRIGWLLLFYLKTWYVYNIIDRSFQSFDFIQLSSCHCFSFFLANQVIRNLPCIKTCALHARKMKKLVCYLI